MQAVKAVLKPELLHRLDGVIVFRSLDAEDYEKIAKQQLEKLRSQARSCKCELTWTKAAVQQLAAGADTVHAGARGIRTYMVQAVETMLAEKMLGNGASAYDRLRVQ